MCATVWSVDGWVAMIGATAPSAVVSVEGGGALQRGVVPPFWAASRDRLSAHGSAAWSPSEAVRLSLHVDGWRQDRYTGGVVRQGPGDITMGVEVSPLPWLGAVWLVKQPNAADGQQLGSDEVDVALLARAQASWGAAAIGAVVRGDPLRYSAQDVGLSGWVAGWHGVGPVRLSGRVSGSGPSAYNPARLEGAVGGRVGCRLRGGAELTAGLTEAAPDWGGRVWLGAAWGCADDISG